MFTIATSKLHRRYTHRPPPASVLRAAPKYARLGNAVPTSVDPRSLCLPIRDQGQEGSCTGHGTTALRELSHAYAAGAPLSGWLSPAMTYALSRQAEGSFPADSGSSVADSVATLQEYGTCPETVLPYDSDPAEAPTPLAYTAALPYRISDAPCLVDLTDEDTLREVLALQRGIAIGITVYQSFESTGSDGIVPIFQPDESILGGHEMCLVGYTSDGNHIVRNSWGPGWGLAGYCLFQPGQLAQLASEAWTIQPQAAQGAA